jgi:phosphoenolpyruvate carboxykinase (ATP)
MLPAVAKMLFRLPDAADVIDNPNPDELQQLAARMPNARWTRYDSLNVQTEVVSRSKKSTYIVTDEPDGQNQAITREEGERWAERQDEYIAEQEMVVIDGYIGTTPTSARPPRLYIEAANANIAGMQQQLYFSPAEDDELEPELTVIYTPNLKAEGYPDDRLIAVDLEQGVTRVFNSDYFGESKKGGLRMWNKLVYDRGGNPAPRRLQDHPDRAREASRPDRRPIRHGEDHHHLHPPERLAAGAGRLRGVDAERARVRDRERLLREDLRAQPEDEPTIYGAVTQPRSYLENVSQHGDEVDFYDTNYTSNGRATFPFDVIEAASADEIEEAHFL